MHYSSVHWIKLAQDCGILFLISYFSEYFLFFSFIFISRYDSETSCSLYSLELWFNSYSDKATVTSSITVFLVSTVCSHLAHNSESLISDTELFLLCTEVFIPGKHSRTTKRLTQNIWCLQIALYRNTVCIEWTDRLKPLKKQSEIPVVKVEDGSLLKDEPGDEPWTFYTKRVCILKIKCVLRSSRLNYLFQILCSFSTKCNFCLMNPSVILCHPPVVPGQVKTVFLRVFPKSALKNSVATSLSQIRKNLKSL